MPVLNKMVNIYKGFGLELVERLWHEGVFEEGMLSLNILRPVRRESLQLL